MSVSSIMNNGLSALTANQTALRNTSNNISNVNTEGYVRQETQMTAVSYGQESAGVRAVTERAANQYLAATHLSSISAQSRYEIEADLVDRAQAGLGDPSGATSIFSSIDGILEKSAALLNDPGSSLRKGDMVAAMQTTFEDIQNGYRTVENLRKEANGNIVSALSSANETMSQIADLNIEIQHMKAIGGDASGLETEQSKLLDSLSEVIDFKLNYQSAGGVELRTRTGALLVNREAGTLSISEDTDASGYGGISLTPAGAADDYAIDITQQIQGGEIRGLLSARDGDLAEMAFELGELSGAIANALNAASNEGTSVPPPTSLDGRNTGLVASDSLNFTGSSVFAVVDSSGRTVDTVTVDFDAGTLTNSAGAVSATGTTIGSFATALNASFGANASVDFTDGALNFSATGTNGVAIAQDPTNPSDRAGRGVSAFFGMNDVVSSTKPSFYDTGLTAADAHGITGTITFGIRNENGDVISRVEYTPVGTTMADLVNELNSSAVLGQFATASLDSIGRLQLASDSNNGVAAVDVVEDGTDRGGTGLSMSEVFGLAIRTPAERANTLSVREDIALDPSRLPSSGFDLSKMAVGSLAIAPGDNTGAMAMQSALASPVTTYTAGGSAETTASITDLAAKVAANAGAKATHLENRAMSAEALKTEAAARRSSAEGVNLDEEMINMTIYQQSYSAASRLVTAARDMYDVLLNMI